MRDWEQYVHTHLSLPDLDRERVSRMMRELASQLEDLYREAVGRGMTESDADAFARSQITDWTGLADTLRAVDRPHIRPTVDRWSERLDDHAREKQERWSMFADLSQDVRYASRRLLARPGFSILVMLTLALGIGATTAIFSVVYSVLIKPLPYPNADELVRIRHPAPGMNVDDLGADPTLYFTYRGENRTLASIGLWSEDSATLNGLHEPERVRALVVSHGTLQALGVQPMRGRWFTELEHGPAAAGAAPVILSYGFWQRRFGGDEATLGREFSIDSRPSQVVGVMPRNFRFLDMTPQPDVILAMRLDPARQAIGNFGSQALARLRPGVTSVEAQADLERVLPLWRDAWPLLPGVSLTKKDLGNLQIKPAVRPLKDDLVGGVASMLWVVMSAIGAVLLIACANIANLMLVRADGRRQEFAVRAALGAVPARIVRELLIESLVIGVVGAVLGLVLAYLGLQALVAIGPSNLPRLREIAVYPPVLVFTMAVSLAATLLFGSITALKQALHIDTPMTSAARGASASRERSITRNALVVVQVALALVLVVSAALMVRTFQALRDVDPGFSDAATIQTARIWIPTALLRDPKQYTLMQHEILDKLAALPGITSVGFTNTLPMERPPQSGAPLLVEGQTLAAAATPPLRRLKFVSPGYFEAMGTRVIAGRDLSWSDIEAGGKVAVISEDFARELAAEPASALGKRIRPVFGQDAWREVVGVVQSVHEDALYEEPSSFVYWPVLAEDFFGSPAFGTPYVALVIRSERAGTSGLMNEVRQAVMSVNASIPIAQVRTMQDLYAGSLARTSFTLVMLSIAGAMALALGIIGIYGVIAYVVSQRTREIGIRLALGAEPRQVAKIFLLHGFALSGVGLAVGLVAAVALGRAMSSLLFGIGLMDPVAYIAALGVMLVATVLASYLPARRAAKIDPMETMKAE